MKAKTLIKKLESNDVKIWIEDDKVKWNAPKGVITENILVQMKDKKPELLVTLRDRLRTAKAETKGNNSNELEKPEVQGGTIKMLDGLVDQVQKIIQGVLDENNKKMKNIVSVVVPLKSVIQKCDVVIEWDTEWGDSDPFESPTTPKVNKPDDYDGDQNDERKIEAATCRSPRLLPERCSDISPHLNKITLGDCLEKLKDISENSVDVIVTDPPYGLKFMGKNWDKAVPTVEVWKEALRVLKPGGLAYIMCGPRQDCLSRMIRNLEEAGFRVNFSSLYWTQAQGFSKAHNISKAVDKKFGAERIKIARNPNSRENCDKTNTVYESGTVGKTAYLTAPATPEGKRFDGAYGGFQPKPAVEVIIVAMKPMDEKTYVDQVLKNGKGVTWLDDCRIPYSSNREKWSQGSGIVWSPERKWNQKHDRSCNDNGRFPANLLVSDDVLHNGKKYKSGSWCRYEKHKFCKEVGKDNYKKWLRVEEDTFSYSRFFSLDAWAEKNLPYLIVPKASPKEKNLGLDDFREETVTDGRKKTNDTPFQRGKTLRKNTHPTVKPILLMSYLITMGSREGDVVLDPFCGSGSTCVAAKMLNRKFIGIELDKRYRDIAAKRIEAAKPSVTQLPSTADNTEVRKCTGAVNIKEGIKHGAKRESRIEIEQDNSNLINKVSLGDCFNVLKRIENSTVDLVLTSPPYANLRNYGCDIPVPHPDDYTDWILPLFDEVYRVLNPSGSFILNINDRIVNKKRHPYVYDLISRATRETSLRLYDVYFWFKKTAMPNGNQKRLNNVTEYLIHFCNDEKLVKWNMDAVREPYDENTVNRCQYPVSSFNLEVDKKGRPKDRKRKVVQLNQKGKVPSNVFRFPTAAAVRRKKHPAVFHLDLPSWFIKALTDEGDLVLDPFAGSGTTCLAAKLLNRNHIGIEINPAYHKVAVRKVSSVTVLAQSQKKNSRIITQLDDKEEKRCQQR